MHRTRSIGVLVTTATFVLLALPGAATATGASSCRGVQGHLVGVGIPQVADGALTGFHVVVTQVTGDLAGAAITADLRVSRALPGGGLHLDGGHHVADPAIGLDIRTADHVRITPGGVVNDTLTVVEGGGGALHTHGTVDLSTGAVELDYHGSVCT